MIKVAIFQKITKILRKNYRKSYQNHRKNETLYILMLNKFPNKHTKNVTMYICISMKEGTIEEKRLTITLLLFSGNNNV